MRIRLVIVCFLGLVLSEPRLARAQSAPVTLLDYHTTAPPAWVSRTPSSSSRLAQFIIASAGGSDTAEVVVFFFGSAQGGNVEANLARWRGQFSTADGSPVPETVTRDSSGAFPLTLAEFRGMYRRGIGAGSADSVKAGQTLIASIVETPKGTLFIQMFGPTVRVALSRDEFIRFVKELK
jgi:hypothetical protein